MPKNGSIPVIVVATLSIVAIGGLAIMGYLAFAEKAIPDQIDRFAFGALTAIGAILATTRGAAEEGVTPVEVVNPPTDPVPTEDIA